MSNVPTEVCCSSYPLHCNVSPKLAPSGCLAGLLGRSSIITLFPHGNCRRNRSTESPPELPIPKLTGDLAQPHPLDDNLDDKNYQPSRWMPAYYDSINPNQTQEHKIHNLMIHRQHTTRHRMKLRVIKPNDSRRNKHRKDLHVAQMTVLHMKMGQKVNRVK